MDDVVKELVDVTVTTSSPWSPSPRTPGKKFEARLQRLVVDVTLTVRGLQGRSGCSPGAGCARKHPILYVA